jgi:hypothetical protein
MLAVMTEIPDEARRPFRTSPFVAERDALVKKLGADGRDGDAAMVKALRKPAASVWALSQLPERERDALAALFKAERALRAAHKEVLAGGSADLVAAAARGGRPLDVRDHLDPRRGGPPGRSPNGGNRGGACNPPNRAILDELKADRDSGAWTSFPRRKS